MSASAWWPGGSTRLVGIVGHPVAQVKAPRELTRHLRGAGVDAVVLPFDVAPGDLAAFLAALALSPSVAGVVVTIPHKPAALGLAAEATRRASRTGAANVLTRRADGSWSADNVDGAGFLGGLRAGGVDPWGRRALVVGAGGVGSAIAIALADAGADVLLHDVDRTRAERLAERVPRSLVLPGPDPAGCDLAVNATPAGMRAGDPLPFDVSRLGPGAAVAEVVMEPAETPLLKRAASLGLRVFPGRLVLEHQLALLAAQLFPASQDHEERT